MAHPTQNRVHIFSSIDISTKKDAYLQNLLHAPVGFGDTHDWLGQKLAKGFSKLYLDFLFKEILDFPSFLKENGTFTKFELQTYKWRYLY